MGGLIGSGPGGAGGRFGPFGFGPASSPGELGSTVGVAASVMDVPTAAAAASFRCAWGAGVQAAPKPIRSEDEQNSAAATRQERAPPRELERNEKGGIDMTLGPAMEA